MQTEGAVMRSSTPISRGDEAALVQAAREDPTAFATLYQAYVDRIYWYLRARTPREEDAADLTQQVFLRAWDALPRYHAQRVPFAAWLFRIARNAAIDLHRRHRTTVPWDVLPEGLSSDDITDLEAAALQAEAYARVRVLLAQLSPEKRDLLALRFGARLSAAEIAVVMGKSEAATKKQLGRILQFLKEKYRDDLS